jgi:heat shock protein HslJ
VAFSVALVLLTGWLAACTSDEQVDAGGGDGAGSGSASPAPAEGAAGATSLAGSSWDLDAVVPDGVRQAAVGGATLRFGADGVLSGSTGCNTFSGTYRQDGGELTLETGAMTRRACEDETVQAQEDALMRLLPAVESFERTEFALELLADGGSSVVYRAGRSGVTGTWQVTGVNNGRQALESTELTAALSLTFGEDGTVSGSDGCNRLAGSYTVDGDALTVEVAGGTMMACEPDVTALAEQFRAALDAASTFEVTGDQLTLRDDEGAMQVTATVAG